MNDSVKIKGTVVLEIFKDGELIKTETQKNLVVYLGLQTLAILLSAGTSGRVVTKIGFGTGSAEPALGDTGLTSAFVKSLASYAYPNQNQVAFGFTLAQSEANGTTIREMGLLSTNNTLFNRIVRQPIVKDSSISLSGTWTIEF